MELGGPQRSVLHGRDEAVTTVLGGAQPETRNLLQMLIQRRRLELVPEINALFHDAVMAHKGIVLVDVTRFDRWSDCATLGHRDGAPPIVVLTGWVSADGRFRKRAFDAGCAAFIAKPCHPGALVTVLRRVLDGERGIAVT